MQGFWLLFGLLIFVGGPIAGFTLLYYVVNKAAAPWRNRMIARRLDAIAAEHNEIQKHRKVWAE